MNDSSSSFQRAFTRAWYVPSIMPCIGLAVALLLCTGAHAAEHESEAPPQSVPEGVRVDSLLVRGERAQAEQGDSSLSVAAPAESATVAARPCSPKVAFLLALPVPGGGQFYLGDLAGGLQAVATDVLLAGALISGSASAVGIVSFIATVHVVEGLFAAQECSFRRQARETPACGAPTSGNRP